MGGTKACLRYLFFGGGKTTTFCVYLLHEWLGAAIVFACLWNVCFTLFSETIGIVFCKLIVMSFSLIFTHYALLFVSIFWLCLEAVFSGYGCNWYAFFKTFLLILISSYDRSYDFNCERDSGDLRLFHMVTGSY